MESYVARWTGLTIGILSGCGTQAATIGVLPPDPHDSGNPPETMIDAGRGTPDSLTPDSELPRIDAGAARFHLIDPTPTHLKRAADHPGTRRLFTSAMPTSPAFAISKWVSSDGSVVLGQSSVTTTDINDPTKNVTSDGVEIVRWTESSGTVGLGVLPPCERTDGSLPRGFPDGMSSDGSVIFGSCQLDTPPSQSPGSQSFRWTQASGMVAVFAPGYPNASWDVSTADGTVAAGTADRHTGDYQAFQWTQAAGVQLLGVLPGTTFSDPRLLTPDGRTIIGSSGKGIFRWSQATGMVGLAIPASYETCIPSDVSDDGNIVIGGCSEPDQNAVPLEGVQARLFLWKGNSAPVMVPLPTGPSWRSYSGGMSPDGAVIVGEVYRRGELGRPQSTVGFRWSESTGSVEIMLPGYTDCRVVYSPGSADGASLMGSCEVLQSDNTPLRGAFRWTQATGPVSLPPLPGHSGAIADAISADGTIVIGRSVLPGPDVLDPTTPPDAYPVRVPRYVAVMWDANGNVTSLTDLFTSMGFDLQGYTLKTGTISPTDAHVISGVASNAENLVRGWIARLP